MNSANRNYHSGPQSAKTVRSNADASKSTPRKRSITSPKFEYRPSKLILEQNLTYKQNKYAILKRALDDAQTKFDAHHKILNAFQNQLKRKGLTDKLITLTPANETIRFTHKFADTIQEYFNNMYDDLNTMFKRKKNEFKQMYADDSKTDQVVESVTCNNIIVSEIQLETFKATKSLEVDTFRLIRTLEAVEADAVDVTNSNKINKQLLPVSEKPSATQTIDNCNETDLNSEQNKLTEVRQLTEKLAETEQCYEIQPVELDDETANAATSTTDLLAHQQSTSLESKKVAAENAALVHKNGLLNSLSETQRITINELQQLVDKLNADCAEQRRMIALHQRTLRVRCDVLDSFTSLRSMNPKCSVADLFSDDTSSAQHMQFKIAARSEEMSNLFSTLSEKHRCVLKQRQTIELLQVTNQAQVNRISQLERDVAGLQVSMSNCQGASAEHRRTRSVLSG